MNNLYKALDKQVANLGVFYVKLHHFHWLIEGNMFLSLHAKFEELYDEVNDLWDEVAERLIIIGGIPATSMKSFLQITSLSEASGKKPQLEMVKEVINDLNHLVIEFREVVEIAEKQHDDSTADIFINTIKSFQKYIWIFESLLK